MRDFRLSSDSDLLLSLRMRLYMELLRSESALLHTARIYVSAIPHVVGS